MSNFSSCSLFILANLMGAFFTFMALRSFSRSVGVAPGAVLFSVALAIWPISTGSLGAVLLIRRTFGLTQDCAWPFLPGKESST